MLLFWFGYVSITFAVGFTTSKVIPSEVYQLTAWGFVSSLGLLVLARKLRVGQARPPSVDREPQRPSFTGGLLLGLLIGAISFGVHLAVLRAFAGPFRLEVVPGVGFAVSLIYFARFMATSCMEEIGFRGYALDRLESKFGPMAAVAVTGVAFGASHFLYGWEARTILMGVIPGGLLWGMSAIATRGLAVPIGLHAAWNFASWTAGARAERGPLQIVADESTLARLKAVGTASYLMNFGALTLVFWFIHRRQQRRPVDGAL